MTAKCLDRYHRWRNKTVAFRVSPEENELISTLVRLSGKTKQDYIIDRLLQREVVVQGNPRVYKALRGQLAAVHQELLRIEGGGDVTPEFMEVLRFTTTILNGMKEEYHG